METTRLLARIEQLFETEAEWLISDPVLLKGEFAVVKFGNTNKIKIGDGIKKFSQLPYAIFETGDTIDGITPASPAVTPTAPISFVAETGVYPNFGGVEITGAAGYIVWNGAEWKAVNIVINLGRYSKTLDATNNLIEQGVFSIGKNLFNINKSSAIGSWCNYTNGEFQSYPDNPYIESFKFSEYILVSPNSQYTRTHANDGTSFFDADKVFISGTQLATFTTPISAKYAVLNSTNDYVQLEKGTVSTTYERFGIEFESPVVKPVQRIDVFQADFIKKSRDILNIKNLSKRGNWFNYVSGEYQSTVDNPAIAAFRHTAPITIFPNTQYVRLHGEDSTVFLDEKLNFLSGVTTSAFTTPAKARFLVMNIINYHLDECLNLGISVYQKNNIYKETYSVYSTGKNLFNVKEISNINEWCSYTSGLIESNMYVVNFYYSNPIPIRPETVYVRKYGTYGTAFFDEDMQFISGTQNNSFTTPNNARYLILNLFFGKLIEQLELGTKTTNYEVYVENDDELFKPYTLNLPKTVYGVVGMETNIYYDNLMIDDANKYKIRVEDGISIKQENRCVINSIGSGTFDHSILVFKNRTDNLDCLTKADTSIKIAPVLAGSGVTKKYLQIGDSTTFAMMANAGLHANFDADEMNLTQIGTQGSDPNLHEGYPGKSTTFIYTDPASPFVFDGVFDFPAYMADNGFSGVDIVGIHEGINDVYGAQSDDQALAIFELTKAQFDIMFASMKAYNPNIKIGVLLTIPPAYSQDAFNEVNVQTRFRHKRNVAIFVHKMIEYYDGRESENIYVVPFNANLDTVNNFPVSSVPINSRNATVVQRQSNALHPDVSGYLQMADSVYCWIKNIV